jgi:hypothetical protein
MVADFSHNHNAEFTGDITSEIAIWRFGDSFTSGTDSG